MHGKLTYFRLFSGYIPKTVMHFIFLPPGVVPGHCTAKELNPGSEVIIFLRKKDAADSTYEQTYTAEKYSSFAIEKYISVCDMAMEYPQGTVMRIIKLKIFPVPVHLHSDYGKLIFVIMYHFCNI